MKKFAFDAHVHTSFSYDAWQSPEKVIETAIRIGLSAIAITDHNSFLGVLRAQKATLEKSIIVIPGEEVSTEYGDLIGLFLNEGIESRVFADVLDEIHHQGGISILPHPMRRKKMPPTDLLRKIDMFETLNCRTPPSLNNESEKLARSFHKPNIGGSDAHFFWEIGRIRNITSCSLNSTEEVRKALLEKDFSQSRYCESNLMRKLNIGMSYAIKELNGIKQNLINTSSDYMFKS